MLASVRTLHPGFRVANLAASLDFYTALGYGQVGHLDFGEGHSLTMLKLPDDEVVTLELVHRAADGPVEIGTGFSHLAVQVDDLSATIEALLQAGLTPGTVERPGGAEGPQTAWLTDPDGYRIELVQWPPGHPYGMTAADFPARNL
jgi:lactoylglutathione lyase